MWQGLVLKEKDFRAALKEIDWQKYDGVALCIHCSADAIVPTWAYMLVASHAAPFAEKVFMGTRDEFLSAWFAETIDKMEKRIEFDLEYLRRWSVLFDLKIVVLTVFKGFVGKNVY